MSNPTKHWRDAPCTAVPMRNDGPSLWCLLMHPSLLTRQVHCVTICVLPVLYWCISHFYRVASCHKFHAWKCLKKLALSIDMFFNVNFCAYVLIYMEIQDEGNIWMCQSGRGSGALKLEKYSLAAHFPTLAVSHIYATWPNLIWFILYWKYILTHSKKYVWYQ